MNKKAMLATIISFILLSICIIIIVAYLYVDSKDIAKEIISINDYCEQQGLHYRLKYCGWGCQEKQCYNESGIFEAMFDNGGVILIPK